TAIRCEPAVLFGIAKRVCRAVAAQLVQNKYSVGLYIVEPLIEVIGEDRIQALALVAGGFVTGLEKRLVCHARGNAFVAGIVIPPLYVDTSVMQHIEEIFRLKPLLMCVVFARVMGEHARERNGRDGAAAAG